MLIALRCMLHALVVRPLVRAFARPFVVCGDVPRGPAIFVANHGGHADAPVLLEALPRLVRARTRVAAAEDYFYRSKLLGLLATLAIGAFPFPRARGCTLGLERSARLLEQGCSVLIFPEGTRSADGSLARFKLGVARLALATGVPVVPVYLDGARAILPRGAHWPRRAAVCVSFGAAMWPLEGEAPDALTARLQATVSRLGSAARAGHAMVQSEGTTAYRQGPLPASGGHGRRRTGRGVGRFRQRCVPDPERPSRESGDGAEGGDHFLAEQPDRFRHQV